MIFMLNLPPAVLACAASVETYSRERKLDMPDKNLLWEILLWIAIHRGDPNPEATIIHQLIFLEAFKEMASMLPNADLRSQIQALTTKAITSLAQQMAHG